jgi:hypothetical protein
MRSIKLPSSLFSQSQADPWWSKIPPNDLVKMPLKQVYIPLSRTGLKPFIDRLYYELELKGLKKFKPHFWFSNEWFTPDGVGGIAIPFYLAHRKLAKLEEKYLYEVEGGTPQWFMQLLRHECGHAIDNAYRLRRKRKRQKIFGKSSTKYEDYYIPKPFSRKYVVHLDTWYAQSHPDEDFAETFAVWLRPKSNWKRRYQGWKALKKLEYMNELMEEIGANKPLLTNKDKVEPQQELTLSLERHYQKRRRYYGIESINHYDIQLLKLFTNTPTLGQKVSAARFLRANRPQIRKVVAKSVGSYQYVINQILDDIISRCDQLNLFLRASEDISKLEFTSMFSIMTIEYIREGNHKVPR